MSTTGVVIDLDVKYAGDTLLVEAGATDRVLAVKSVLDYADPEDGAGWIFTGDPVTGVGTAREYVAVDATASTITLAEDPGQILTAGTTLYAWDPTTIEGSVVAEYVAVVDIDEPKPVPGVIIPHHLIVFSDVEYLRGASVAIEENDDGEWEITEVFARKPVLDGSLSNVKWEDDNPHILTAAEVVAGEFVHPLKHARIVDRSMQVTWGRVQPAQHYVVDLDAGTLTYSLEGNERAGDIFDLHYQYLQGPGRPQRIFARAATSFHDFPVVAPSTAAGDSVLLAATKQTGINHTDLNGWTHLGDSASVTHAGADGTYTYRLGLYSITAPSGALPLPTFTATGSGQDCPWVMVATTGTDGLDDAVFATVGDASSAATPALTNVALRVWAIVADNQHITASGNLIAESNPPADPGALNSIGIVVHDATGSATAAVDDTAGWLLASISEVLA